MDIVVRGTVVEWRGPAPFHFVLVPADQADAIRALAPGVTYGWGMVPVTGTLGATEFTTSLWPRQGSYAIPIKDAVRHAEGIGLGDTVSVTLRLGR
jgi:hypothetical protein